MSAVPYTFEPRADTRVTNIRLGLWLFLASEAMFFGSLFSAYVLLYAGAAQWADTRAVLSLPDAAGLTILLVLATRAVATRPMWAAGFGAVFLAAKLLDYWQLWAAGVRPETTLMAASWFVLTGVHWLHVAAGVAAAVWVARARTAIPAAHHYQRVQALRLYWLFVDLVWIAILACFYFS